MVGPSSGEGFAEYWRLRAREIVSSLHRAGADVFFLGTEAEASPETPDARSAVAFDPDVVLATTFNHYLLCVAGDGVVARLQKPAIQLWDDPLGALALWSLIQRGGELGSLGPVRTGDELERFRATMDAVPMHHLAWDTGHIETVCGLGLAHRSRVSWYPMVSYRPFLEQGQIEATQDVDVSFCGNIWSAAVEAGSFSRDQFFSELTAAVCRRKAQVPALSAWVVLWDAIDEIEATERQARGLTASDTPFWDYYLHVVWLAMNTHVRLTLLTDIPREVAIFGVFADPASKARLESQPNLRYAGHTAPFASLPQTYARTKVNVCISNALIYAGVPSKLIECLASGGFALVDAKADLVRLFGKDVEKIVFRSADDLNAKIEYYLARPAERREIVEGLRATIDERCSIEKLASLILQAAATL
ncbi:MAG TPA: glycosyltransferase [Actinomycetota bacterium]|nr:glycosyltransferase [Actinomycetota bacterium]